jgi:predicted RNase H-like HicB family nuclease
VVNLPRSRHSKDLAARQNGTTVGAVAQPRKFFVTLEQDEDGWFVAKCPSLPGCVSQGKTREEAIANIREAIEGSLETRAANSIPSNIETIEIEIL